MTKHEARSTKHENISNFEFRYSSFHASRGYTLIEMLISVTIFSGLLIIVLGAVASSSSSTAKVSTLREKSQAARTLIDQITNDSRYIDSKAVFQDERLPGHTCRSNNGNCLYDGFFINSNRLVLALHYPNADSAAPLVRKEYNIEILDNRLTLTMKESRNCQITTYLFSCTQQSVKTNLLSTAYVLNVGQADWQSKFAGLTIDDGQSSTPPVTAYLAIILTIKPIEFQSSSCQDLDSGSCYKVSTTVNVGTL